MTRGSWLVYVLSLVVYLLAALSFPAIMLLHLNDEPLFVVALLPLLVWYPVFFLSESWQSEQAVLPNLLSAWRNRVRSNPANILKIHRYYLHAILLPGAIFFAVWLYVVGGNVHLSDVVKWAVTFWFEAIYFLGFRYFASFRSTFFGLDYDSLGIASTFCASAYAKASNKAVTYSSSEALRYLRVSLLMTGRMLDFRKYNSRLPRQLLARVNADQLGKEPYAQYPDLCEALGKLPDYTDLAKQKECLAERASWVSEFIPPEERHDLRDRLQGIATIGIGILTVVVTLLSGEANKQLAASIGPALPRIVAGLIAIVLMAYLMRLTNQVRGMAPAVDDRTYEGLHPDLRHES